MFMWHFLLRSSVILPLNTFLMSKVIPDNTFESWLYSAAAGVPRGSEADVSSELFSPTSVMSFSHERWCAQGWPAGYLSNTRLNHLLLFQPIAICKLIPHSWLKTLYPLNLSLSFQNSIVSNGHRNREYGPLWSFSNLLTHKMYVMFSPGCLHFSDLDYLIKLQDMFVGFINNTNHWPNLTCQRGSFWSGKSSKYLWASCTGGRVWSRKLVQLCTKLARLTNVYNPSRSFP